MFQNFKTWCGVTGPEVVYAYTPMTSTFVNVNTCGSDFQPYIYFFTDANSRNTYSCSDSNVTCSASTVTLGLSAVRIFGGVTYYFVLEAPDASASEYTLSITESVTLQSV